MSCVTERFVLTVIIVHCIDGPSAVTIGAVKSALIGGAATPATTDGSQCSSSCSTVVVAGTTTDSVNLVKHTNSSL